MELLSIRFFSKFLGVMLLGLFVLAFHTSDAQANAAWKTIRGHSACGGVDQSGRLQPACGFKKATYVKKSIKTCPNGSFAGGGACYTCPTGFNRNILRKVTGEKACRKAVSTQTAAAKRLGSASCPSGSKFDPRNGGECWRCPSGFIRTGAAVNKWNACGRIGKKAQSSTFVGRFCPAKGSFYDPRKGGECWTCPEDYSRTANPVTGARACKTNFAFANANQVSDKKCGPGEIHDIIDGGTCWTCPDSYKRTTLFGIKSAKACRNKTMEWVVPTRQQYGLFGLGTGAENILAKLIADRVKIDEAIKQVARRTNENEASALKNGWDVIDNRPEESPILGALLADIAVVAAEKPASQRTSSENDLLARLAQLIQWNRQFIAYQAKQAHENWTVANQKAYEERVKHMGVASLFTSNTITPPNYNELLVNSLQSGVGLLGPTTVVVLKAAITPIGKAIAPYAFHKVAGATVSASWSMSSATTAAAAGPLVIVLSAAVITAMEIDKFMKIAEADGQIRQSIAIANRSVDIPTLLQKKNGGDDFLFHWASLINEKRKPSANFVRLLTAYKADETPDADPSTAEIELNPSLGITSSSVLIEAPKAPARVLTPEEKAMLKHQKLISNINRAVQSQSPLMQPFGFGVNRKNPLRIELSSRAGTCLSKASKDNLDMNLNGCKYRSSLWVIPDTRSKALIFAEKYCLRMAAANAKDKKPEHLIIEKCNSDPAQKFELTEEGYIKQVDTNKCLTAVGRRVQNTVITSKDCGTDMDNQVWRPWKR